MIRRCRVLCDPVASVLQASSTRPPGGGCGTSISVPGPPWPRAHSPSWSPGVICRPRCQWMARCV
eukprot:263558-Lingulodinium_polyedra.AAC.1